MAGIGPSANFIKSIGENMGKKKGFGKKKFGRLDVPNSGLMKNKKPFGKSKE